jgi:hypothetical protein
MNEIILICLTVILKWISVQRVAANANVYGVAGIGHAKNEAKRNVCMTMYVTFHHGRTNLRNAN